MNIIGFRKIDLNENYDFEYKNEKEKKVEKYICDIGRISELIVTNINDLINYGSSYKKLIDTLDEMEEDYTQYNIEDDKNIAYSDYEYTISDVFHDIDVIPIKRIMQLLDNKMIMYIKNIIPNVFEFKSDLMIISYFYKHYDFEKDDIYIVDKYDDFTIHQDNNKYVIYSDSAQINKIVDWINYI